GRSTAAAVRAKVASAGSGTEGAEGIVVPLAAASSHALPAAPCSATTAEGADGSGGTCSGRTSSNAAPASAARPNTAAWRGSAPRARGRVTGRGGRVAYFMMLVVSMRSVAAAVGRARAGSAVLGQEGAPPRPVVLLPGQHHV